MLRYDECLRSVKNLEHLTAWLLKRMLEDSRNAIVRIPIQHREEITAIPADEYAGWNCIQSPFPHLCVELEGGFIHEQYRCELFVFFKGKNQDILYPQYPWIQIGISVGTQLDDRDQIFAFPVLRRFFDENGAPVSSSDEVDVIWRPVDGVARNILDFLSTPSIRIEREPGMEKINRSRRKCGKPLLTDYHIINWSTQSEQTHSTGHGSP